MFAFRLVLILFLGVFLASCSDESGTTQPRDVKITEWQVPWPDSRPRDPYFESAEKVWFVGQLGDYLGYFNPKTEEFTQIPLFEGVGPHNVIIDAEGNAWFAGNLMGFIGMVKPDGGYAAIVMPEEVYDPHTLIDDGNGGIWFTAQGANVVGHLNKNDFSKTFVTVPTPDARPYGITIAPDGKVWVALFGANKLAAIDPETMTLTEIALPRALARPRRLGAASDGAIWYVDYAEGYLGRYDPENENFEEWRTPGADQSGPYGMAVDKDDRIWFVETGLAPNRLVGFDPDSQQFFSITDIESGGGSVRNIMYHAPTNTLWFGTDANTLARAELP